MGPWQPDCLRWAREFGFALSILLVATPAAAQLDPAEASSPPLEQEEAGAQRDSSGGAAAARDAAERTETGVLPAIGYDSNTGLGLGALANVAHIEPGYRPYSWQVRAQVYLTFQETPDGLQTPLHDHFVEVDVPSLLGGDLRLIVRLAYLQNSQVGYYGIGAAAERDTALVEQNYRHYFYTSAGPFARLMARYLLARPLEGRFELFGRGEVQVHETTVEPGSKLDEDLTSPDPVTQSLLFGTGSQFRTELSTGVLLDTRQDEVAPESGMFHEVSVRGDVMTVDSGAYVGGNLTLRFYQALVPRYLVFAGRFSADIVHGEAPVRELARMGGVYQNYATGGAMSVRGVLAQRFHGQGKVLFNTEARSRLLSFPLFRQTFDVGVLGFLDWGRVWAEGFKPSPLDAGAGFYTGVGGGLRLHWGRAFVVRADYGHSPSDGTSGFYLDIMHVF